MAKYKVISQMDGALDYSQVEIINVPSGQSVSDWIEENWRMESYNFHWEKVRVPSQRKRMSLNSRNKIVKGLQKSQKKAKKTVKSYHPGIADIPYKKKKSIMKHKSRGLNKKVSLKYRAKFTKKNGGTFTKRFKSSSSRARAIAGWKSAGGKVTKIKRK